MTKAFSFRFLSKIFLVSFIFIFLRSGAVLAQESPEAPLGPATGYPEFIINELAADASLPESELIFPINAYQLEDRAGFWATQSPNSTVEEQGCALSLTGSDESLTVVQLKGATVAASCLLTIKSHSEATILLNISGQNIDWAAPALEIEGVSNEQIIFNFYEATRLRLGIGQIEGTILAPFAIVESDDSLLMGALVARELAGNLRTSFVQFGGVLPALAYDFGDLPAEMSFATSLADNGARHAQGEALFLGQDVDSEPDGQPDFSAWGDGQDETGVLQWGSWRDGAEGGVMEIIVGAGAGCLNGWFDLDESGAFEDDEHLLSNIAVSAVAGGRYEMAIDLPEGTIQNPTIIYARFRLTPRTVTDECTETVGPAGFASGGEVEDYFWPTNPSPTAVSWSGLSAAGLLNSPLLPAMLLVSIMVSILVMVGITIVRGRTGRDLRQ